MMTERNKWLGLILSILCTVFLFCRDDNPYQECFIGKISNQNFCLLNIPKNASTHLRRSLFKPNSPKYCFFDKSNIAQKDFQYLLCVRDPMYRPISAYHEIMKLRNDAFPKITRSKEFYKNRNDLLLSFKLFLDEIEDHFYDPHASFQYKVLEKKGLKLSDMTFIFLFENLSKDIMVFNHLYSTETSTRVERSTPAYKKRTLREYIDNHPEIQAKIRKIWAKDFAFYEEAKKMREQILKKMLNLQAGSVQ